MKSTFAGLLLASLTSANVTKKGREMFPDFHLNMRIDERKTDYVIFDVYAPDDSYFGLVLGDGGMRRGADMVIFHADGSDSYCTDRTSIGYTKPAKDTKTNLSCTTSKKDGQIHFVGRRKLDTSDSKDFLI